VPRSPPLSYGDGRITENPLGPSKSQEGIRTHVFWWFDPNQSPNSGWYDSFLQCARERRLCIFSTRSFSVCVRCMPYVGVRVHAYTSAWLYLEMYLSEIVLNRDVCACECARPLEMIRERIDCVRIYILELNFQRPNAYYVLHFQKNGYLQVTVVLYKFARAQWRISEFLQILRT